MFKRFTFLDQMEENTKFSLLFPFHIHHERLIGNDFYNKEFPNTYHCHSFEEVLHKAYREPKAFYLTEEDKKYYSSQEITFIKKVIEDEVKRIDSGMVIVNLDLEDETLTFIEEYKLKNNLTFEEAITDILKKMIEEKETNK